MRCMDINKRSLWYALYAGKTEVIDSHGNRTGQYKESYSAPVNVQMNISAARGTTGVEPFGISSDYSRTIVTNDVDCPMTEGTILWIGRNPTDSQQHSVPHNYVVTMVARSINSVTYGIKEVDVA